MQQPGAPLVLVVTGNAQRAADLARALRSVRASGDDGAEQPTKRRKTSTQRAEAASPRPAVAKLFARHFKVDEQVKWLKTQAAPLAVGTPHRIKQLVDRNALSLEHTAAIVLDHTWTDAKNRTIFDTPETRAGVVEMLAQANVLAALKRADHPCRIVLF